MKASWDDIQQAFIEERISFEQLLQILVDNYGIEKTMQIIKENLGL